MSRQSHNDENLINDIITGQRVHLSDIGTSFILNSDGSIEYDIAEINSVGIRDLADVLEHRVNTIVGSRLHRVLFVNGGVLTYAYNGAGQLIELTSSDVVAEISKNNEILYYVDSEMCD